LFYTIVNFTESWYNEIMLEEPATGVRLT
jgi:hypothetical protein